MNAPAPAISVVIRVVGGTAFLRRCLAALSKQERPAAREVIVPFDQFAGVDRQLQAEFPDVQFLECDYQDGRGEQLAATPEGRHELYDRRTAFGLAKARGDVVAILEDYGVVPADWCARMLAAHQACPAAGAVGGAVEYTGTSLLGWSVFLLDFSRYLPPLEEGAVAFVSDVNVSYRRNVLARFAETWQPVYNEVQVHWAMLKEGLELRLRPEVLIVQDRGVPRLGQAMYERYQWGRVFGKVRGRHMSWLACAGYLVATPVIPLVVVGRILAKALRTGTQVGRTLRALPLLLLLSLCWCLGEASGYLASSSQAGYGDSRAAASCEISRLAATTNSQSDS